MVKRQKLITGVIGVILLVIGIVWTISLAILEKYIYGFIVTGVFIVIGLTLIAMALGD